MCEKEKTTSQIVYLKSPDDARLLRQISGRKTVLMRTVKIPNKEGNMETWRQYVLARYPSTNGSSDEI